VLSVVEGEPIGTIVLGSEDGALRASDEDVADAYGDTLKYSWTGSSAAAASSMLAFAPSATNPVEVELSAVLDHEEAAEYSLVLRATDSASNTADAFVRLMVVDKNEPSVFQRVERADGSVLGDGESLEIHEMAAGGTVLGRVVATDQDAGAWGNMVFWLDHDSPSSAYFDIDNTGVVTLKSGARLDWEDEESMVLHVVVSDSDLEAPPIVVNTTVGVTVLNDNDVAITSIRVLPASEAAGLGSLVRASDVGSAGREAWGATHGDLDSLFATQGGALVEIWGASFGKTAKRLAREGALAVVGSNPLCLRRLARAEPNLLHLDAKWWRRTRAHAV